MSRGSRSGQSGSGTGRWYERRLQLGGTCFCTSQTFPSRAKKWDVQKHVPPSMTSSFIWKMAWRDSRSSRRRLLLFSISITLGIAALVGIGSFRHSLAQAIDDQARSLIGADLVVESSRKFRPEDEALLHSLGGPQAREVRFATMAVFPRS